MKLTRHEMNQIAHWLDNYNEGMDSPVVDAMVEKLKAMALQEAR